MYSEIEIRKIARTLQSRDENEVTNTVIIPLLNKLYHKVEFFGGYDEDGKDILIWDKDKVDDINLIVAQVKHFKFTNRAKGKTSFQNVVNQLSRCFLTPLLYGNKSSHYPSQAWVISTYEINSKTLISKFSEYPELRTKEIKIIDCDKLVALLIKNTPHIIKDLLGIENEIIAKLRITLNNEPLLKSLGSKNLKNIKNIYTDIDFSVGKSTTQLFFNTSFQPSYYTFEGDKNKWDYFKQLCLLAKKEYCLDYLSKSLDDAEMEFQERVINERQSIQKTKDEKNRLEVILNNHQAERSKLYEEYSGKGTEDLNIFTKTLADVELKINEVKDQIKKCIYIATDVKYSISIDGEKLAVAIESKRKRITDKISKFNSSTLSSEEIGLFIEECKSIVDSTSIFFSHPEYFQCVGFDERDVQRTDLEAEATRLKLPIHQIFDSGKNIIVLGDAGAGKTTSLQMYSIINQDNENKYVIYLPLGTITLNWINSTTEIDDEGRINNFYDGLAKYLSYYDAKISSDEFDSILKTSNVVLLFDGIDEAIKLNKWLPKAIVNLSKVYQEKIQIIVSSRITGSYLEEIPFFPVTLLPFTEGQRNEFIKKWFEDDHKEMILKIKKHLNKSKSISDIIRNPLLTTTFCILAGNEIELPSTEIRLYSERLRLLTGYYDRVKNIDYRLSIQPHTLEFFAQKLAYYLHSENKREDELSNLKKQAVQRSLNMFHESEAMRAVEELFNPCNILIPMTSDGKLGFGHLRYQEHLASREIANRSIDILPLMKLEWWHGPLVLFAQASNDLIWLVKLIDEQSDFASCGIALSKMIKARPRHEQEQLHYMINYLEKIERMDLKLNDDSELNEEF